MYRTDKTYKSATIVGACVVVSLCLGKTKHENTITLPHLIVDNEDDEEFCGRAAFAHCISHEREAEDHQHIASQEPPLIVASIEDGKKVEYKFPDREYIVAPAE